MIKVNDITIIDDSRTVTGLSAPLAKQWGGTGSTSFGVNSIIATNTNGDIVSVNIPQQGTLIWNGSSWESIVIDTMIKIPTLISPSNNQTQVTPTPTLTASSYISAYNNPRSYRTFQLTKSTDVTFSSPIVNININSDSYTVNSVLIYDSYIWRCMDTDVDGATSDWSSTFTFTTALISGNATINAPEVFGDSTTYSVSSIGLVSSNYGIKNVVSIDSTRYVAACYNGNTCILETTNGGTIWSYDTAANVNNVGFGTFLVKHNKQP